MVFSRVQKPFVLAQAPRDLGFEAVGILFYHYHALLPMLESRLLRLFRQASVAMEDPRN